MTRIADLRLPCAECALARDAEYAPPRVAEVTWHPLREDERLVCKRCYMRLYMAERRTSCAR